MTTSILEAFSEAEKRAASRKTQKFFAFASIGIVGFLLFYLYPVIRTIYLSFTNSAITAGGSIEEWVGIDNFIKIFKYEPMMWKALGNSFIYAFCSGFFVLAIALGIALLLAQKRPLTGLFRTLMFLPFIIPAFASVAVFKGLFDPNVGLINTMLYNLFGIQGPGWFKSEDTAMLTMIMFSVWGFGLKMLIFLAALQNVPAELYEAAKIDGAGKLSVFWKITMPAISPMLFLNIILATIDGMKSFSVGYLVGGASGTPNGATLLFPVLIFSRAFEGNFKQLGYAASLALIFFFVLMILVLVQFILSKLYVKEDF